MKNNVRNHILALGFAIVTLFAASMPAAAQYHHTVTVVNDSGYTFYQIKLSRSNDSEWGRDLLGAGVLAPGYQLTVPNLGSGRYDLKVVDESRDVCVITGIDVYTSDTWRITPDILLSCEGY
jgi:hypothetical protein